MSHTSSTGMIIVMDWKNVERTRNYFLVLSQHTTGDVVRIMDALECVERTKTVVR
jgi:hypothetical protein